MVRVKLYYESIGSGEPLVLLHAGVADSQMWDEQVQEFSKHYRVVRFDAQGFGQSPAASDPVPRAEDLYDLLRGLGISRAHVVGVSMGGSAAIDFAVTHSEMVASLVLVAAGVSGYDGPADRWLEEQEALQETAVQRGDIAAAAELDLRIWLAGPGRRIEEMDSGLRDWMYKMALHAQERDRERTRTPPIDPPATQRLHELSLPTLVIVGDQDVQVVLDIADYLAEHIPGARKITMHDTAHMIPMEKPAEFNRLVLEFLREAAASRGASRS